jgi:hypothetical protein
MDPYQLVALNIRELVSGQSRNSNEEKLGADLVYQASTSSGSLTQYQPLQRHQDHQERQQQVPSPSFSLPFVYNTCGNVLIVDISGTNCFIIGPFALFRWLIVCIGYSKLTSYLAEQNGSGGAAIRELLNPPFAKIIETVHDHGGSVVKFAGDSVMAVW